MGKKVLIIRSTVAMKDSHLNRDAKTLIESIVNTGIVLLPVNYTYEFGEIDGVIWDKQEKEEGQLSPEFWKKFREFHGDEEPEEKESTIDDFAKVLLDRVESERYYDPVDDVEKSYNKGLKAAMRIIDGYIKEKTNE